MQVTRNTTWILPLFLIGGLAFFIRYRPVIFGSGAADQKLAKQQASTEGNSVQKLIQAAFAELNADLQASEQQVLDFLKERQQVQAEQKTPFPTGDAVHLRQDRLVDYTQFRLQAVDDYLSRSQDSETAKKPGERFLTEFISWECSANLDEQIPQSLLQLAEQALESGSKDDTVQACYAGVLWFNHRKQEALDAMVALDKKGEQLEIAPALRPLFQTWYWNASRELEESRYNIQTRRRQMLLSLIESLKLEGQKEHPRFFWLHFDKCVQLDRTGWNEFLQALFQNPEISIYHKQLAMGKFRVRFAGSPQDSNEAPHTAEERNAEFQKTLLQAVPNFLRAWHLEPQNPDAPYELLKIATQLDSLGWTEEDWFREIIGLEIDHQDAYEVYFETLQAEAQTEKLLAWANSCLQTEQWETAVPSLGLIAIQKIVERLPVNEEVGKKTEIADWANKFAAAYLEASQNREQQTVHPLSARELGLLTGILVQAEQYQLAAELFDQSGEKLNDDVLLWTRRNRDSLHRETLAMTGPAASEISTFESTTSEVDDSALAIIHKKDPRPEVAQFVASLKKKRLHAEKFASEEWVEFTFDENLPDWFVDADEAHVLNESAIVLREFQPHGNIQLSPTFRFEAPYQLEVIVKLFASEALRSPNNRVAVAIGGSRGHDSKELKFAEYGVTMNGVNVAHLNSQNPDGELLKLKPILHINDAYRLTLEVWPDRVLMYVNDQPIIDDQNVEGIATEIVSFGTIVSDTLTPRSVSLESPRVRKISESQESRLLAYTHKLVQLHPYHPKAYFLHGKSFRNLNQHDAARKEFEKALLLKPDYEEAKRSLAFSYGALKDFRRAILILEGLVNESTDDPILMNELAWNLIVCDDESLRNAPRAIKLAKQACEQSNYENPNIISTLASAYAEQGDFEKAVETLEKAIEISEPQMHEYLNARLADYSASRAVHE